MAQAKGYKKLPKNERSKVVRMRSNMLRVPKKFLDHLAWEVTGDYEIAISNNQIIIKGEVKRCSMCGTELTEDTLHVVMLSDNGTETSFCDRCSVNLKEHFVKEQVGTNSR